MGRPIEAEYADVIKLLYVSYKMRTLPRPGGLFDQDALYVELLFHFIQAMDEVEQKKLESMRR